MEAKKRAAWAFAIGAALLVAPANAAAATTCDLSSGVLDISLPSNNDSVTTSAVVSGAIVVRAAGGNAVTCTGGSPTTNNTNAISIHNGTGTSNNNVIIGDAGDYRPGLVAEAGSDEIEIFVNLNDRPNSELHVSSSASGDWIFFGNDGINPNVLLEDQPDADIFHNNTMSSLSASAGSGAVVFSAQGGLGTGSPMTFPVGFAGGPGEDLLQGGNSRDTLYGAGGADYVEGFGGDDSVEGGLGPNDLLTGGEGDDQVYPGHPADRAEGGPGKDTLGYDALGSGVSADIGGTDFEDLAGTNFDDVLTGSEGPNHIFGLGGDDQIEGRGGEDTLDGDIGADSLNARDGGPDLVPCGPGVDTVSADPPGVDLLEDCDTVVFPAAPPPVEPDAGGSGGGSPVSQPPLEAFGASSLVTLAVTGSRVPAKGPVSVRVRNANAFEVTGSVGGRSVQRLRPAARKRRVALKAKPFVVPAGARRTVRLALPRKLRALLARKRRLSLRLSATVLDGAGNARSLRRTVTLRLARRVR